MNAMTELKRQGKIRAIGLSNFSISQLKEAEKYVSIDSLQPPYSLFWRHVERDVMPYCLKKNITLLAYSPLAQGLLTAKFGPTHKFDKSDNRSRNRLFRGKNAVRAHQALVRLRPIAERNGLSLAQLALAWVIAQPGTSAIAGARNKAQVIENAGAAEVRLSAADLKELDVIGRTVTDVMDDNAVMWN